MNEKTRPTSKCMREDIRHTGTKSITGPLTPERGPCQTQKSIFCQRTPCKYHTWKALLGPKIRFLNFCSSFVSGRLVAAATTWYQRCFVERRQVACLFHMRRLDRGSRVICFYPKELENNYYRLLAYYILTIFWESLITKDTTSSLQTTLSKTKPNRL